LCAGIVAGTRFITLKIATTLHFDQNIGIIWHKRNMLVNDNSAEYNLKKKRNNHETIHDGAIGIKETF